jgi:hypothetical protein
MQARLRRPGAAILAVAWALAALLILFAVENIWLDSLLRSRWHRLPSLVPEEGSTGWLMAFGFMGLSSGLLLVCQIFLIMDRSLVSVKKWGTACLSLCALAFFVLWFRTTGMGESSRPMHSAQTGHSVTLNWKASTSVVDGYHVYRSDSGGEFQDISSKVKDPWPDTRFVDTDVRSGGHYCYFVKAVAHKVESAGSNEVEVSIP